MAICIKAGIEPLIAVKRDEHHPGWRERFTDPGPLADEASAVEAMKHKLKTRAGRAAYGLRHPAKLLLSIDFYTMPAIKKCLTADIFYFNPSSGLRKTS